MKLKNKNISFIKIISLLAIICSYFIGFFQRENIAGGAETDFYNLTWKGILAFKSNFLDTLYNYSSIGEGSLPMFHILNAYLNPFTYSPQSFQFSITIISLLNVIFFSQIIRKRFNLKKLDSYLYSSIFLILPFFRSSAFWGLTENLGWLFLILSIKFYLISEKRKTNIFLVCLFSSLALYTRPYLIFFPIFFIIYNFTKKDFFILKKSLIYYTIFSIPGFLLLYIWGGSVYLGTGDEKINFILEFHQPKFIFKNLIIFASICFFYFFPFHVVSLKKKNKFLKIEKLNVFLIILFGLLTLNYFNVFDYLKNETLGGGVFLKFSQYFFGDNNLFFLIIAFFGIISLFSLMRISKKNLILILCALFIYCTPKYIYQEYFEPLLLIFLFALFDLDKNVKNLLSENKSIFIFLSYFLIYLISSYYYRYNIVVI